MSKTVIGIMGPGNNASPNEIKIGNNLGRLIAKQGWVVLTGGRNVGVMEAASKAARKADGITLGILPFEDKSQASQYLDIAICTGMGSARNNINVLSSDVVVACGSGAGTTSEIMLAIKADKPLILIAPSQKLVEYIAELNYPLPQLCNNAEDAITLIQNLL